MEKKKNQKQHQEEEVKNVQEIITNEDAEKLEGGINADEDEQPSTGVFGLNACCNL